MEKLLAHTLATITQRLDWCYHCGMETEYAQVDVGEFHAQSCLLCQTSDAWMHDGMRRIAGSPEWRRERDAMRKRIQRAAKKASARATKQNQEKRHANAIA